MVKLHLRGTPEWTQGLAFYKINLSHITSNDEDVDWKEPDDLLFVLKDTLLTYVVSTKL